MAQELTEQESLRIAKLEELKKLGINPYPSEEYKTSHHSSDIFEKFSQNPDDDELKNVSLAGRLMSIRVMGKASFAVLQAVSLFAAKEKYSSCRFSKSKSILINSER